MEKLEDNILNIIHANTTKQCASMFTKICIHFWMKERYPFLHLRGSVKEMGVNGIYNPYFPKIMFVLYFYLHLCPIASDH